MTDETDTAPLEDATEGVEPTEDENAEPTTYWDPDEDTPVEEKGEATDEAEEEVATEEAAKPATVKLSDGSEVTLDEVTKGYLRQSDYTRKTQELTQTRKALDTDLQRIEGITQAFVDHLSALVPALPDNALLLRNPTAYMQAKFLHDQAMEKINELIKLGSTPKEIKSQLNDADSKARLADEKQRLAERFPEIATKEGKDKFFASTAEAAQAAGFSIDELNNVTDHRLFVLAHWAEKGLKAAQARETAKAKVANVPPATPRKPGQAPGKGADAAVQKFRKAPTLRNAAAAGWAD